MHIFTWVFLIVLVLGTVLQWWLGRRQQQHVLQHRDTVPNAFQASIDLSAHQKAADYTVAKNQLGQYLLFLDAVILLIWTLGGMLNWLDLSWRSLGWSELWTGVAVMFSVLLMGSVLELPSSYYRTFVLEKHFGFNRSTHKIFIMDWLKSVLLLFVLGVPLLGLVLWLMGNAGDWWWLWVWLVWTGFSLFMMWAYPAFIAPLFNKFEPLQNQDLQTRIEQLLQRNGFSSQGIFVMDGSTRSGHGNAYFTGLGNNKRIVFYDTLLDGLDDHEVEAVLAHEVGHFKHKHVQKRMVSMMLFSLGALALLAWLMQQTWFYTGLGMEQPSTYTALMLFMFISPVFSVFLSPLMAQLSRKHEFEADNFAVEQTNAQTLIHALVKMYKENASSLTPDPLYSAFYDSHPPAPVRVAYLNKFN